MGLTLGIPKESAAGEKRVAVTPSSIKRLKRLGLNILVESGAGSAAAIPDSAYTAEGAEITDSSKVWQAEIVSKVQSPTEAEVNHLRRGSLLISLLQPSVGGEAATGSYLPQGPTQQLAAAQIDAIALELIPRTSRAQSMDVLSSQAGIAGYRAVIEAAHHYPRFFPMMMTSAGMAKPAKVIVLGAGVAGLQAIATARKMGAQVEAYDVRPEVKEQILSLGAKFIDLALAESGAGQGGYAKELSEEGQRRQQQLLTEKLKTADIIVSTANVPGRKAPTLVTEEAVRGLRPGSVIVDMAAASGGNCPLTEADQVISKFGVTIIGLTNYPSLVPYDASQFFSGNITHLLGILIKDEKIHWDFADDILAAACVAYKGESKQSKEPKESKNARESKKSGSEKSV
ncbi:MAG: NAD(P)(+) transhydrogenase (Re/Si-specific) subunit alpha [Bdellovibrio sp.]|nr:MAG: NAD(P)(+) transhydrogenase (Re/Si-specific) subunit alpha [Bdellovibrio sp.]